MKISKREYVYLQEFLNTGEQPRNHAAAIARWRSGVRIPSDPLVFCFNLQVKRTVVEEFSMTRGPL